MLEHIDYVSWQAKSLFSAFNEIDSGGPGFSVKTHSHRAKAEAKANFSLKFVVYSLICSHLLPTANEIAEGNAFAGVCPQRRVGYLWSHVPSGERCVYPTPPLLDTQPPPRYPNPWVPYPTIPIFSWKGPPQHLPWNHKSG